MRVSCPPALPDLRIAVVLAVAWFGIPLAAAQTSLRASVVAGGAADASGGSLRLRATAGQPATGRPSRRAYRTEQGFWPTTRLSPGLLIRAEPLLPLVVEQGGKFRFGTRLTVPAGGPSSFQYWATSMPPTGVAVHAFGPVTVLVTPPTEQVIATVQAVPAGAPTGVHRYTVYAGTYPEGVLSSDAFAYTVTLGAFATGSREAPPAPPPAARAVAPFGSRLAATGATGRDDEVALGRSGSDALAFVDGRPLLPGTVLDFRRLVPAQADSLGGTETMALPDEAAAVVASPEAAASIAADVPETVVLAAPFPNPTRDGATFRFGLPAAGPAQLTVYDAHGRRVAVLADDERSAGWHTASIATDRLASGLYLIRLDAGGAVVTHRFTVLR